MLGRILPESPERYEDTALELILSVIRTGRPLVDIEKARERYSQVGDFRLTKLLARVVSLIESGTSVVDAFYFANMLTVESYSLLKVAEESESLTEGFIRDLISAKREKKSARGKVRSAVITPLIMITAVSFAGAVIIAKLVNIISALQFQGKTLEIPMKSLYTAIAKFPFLGGLFIAGVASTLFLFLVNLWFKKSGSREMKLMVVSKLLALLRRQGVPYSKILKVIASFEKDKKLKRVLNLVGEQSEILPIQEAVRPLLSFLPVAVSTVFMSMLERGDEVEGWNYVNRQMKEIFESKVMIFEKNAPIIGNFLFLVIMIFSMYPVKVVFSALNQVGM